MMFKEPPFQVGTQLTSDLICDRPKSSSTGSVLARHDQSSLGIPDRPGTSLDKQSVEETLTNDLVTADLDHLAPYLWLVSTPSSSHILPLHRQAVRGRSIIPCETPGLHLVWYHDRIFVKPLPAYLLSHAFWSFCLREGLFSETDGRSSGLHAATLGLLRTYVHLIRYPIDFKLAQQHHLVPETATFDGFATFIDAFRDVSDANVAPRYTYGELRLTRLNFYTRIFLFPKLTYYHMTPQWGSFISSMLAPMLSVFAIMSLTLNALQVLMTVQALDIEKYSKEVLVTISWWFSLTALGAHGTVVLLLLAVVMFMFIHEHSFALRVIHRTRGNRKPNEKLSSAVVS